MHHLLVQACNPRQSLHECMQDWRAIGERLAEPARRRKYQRCDDWMIE